MQKVLAWLWLVLEGPALGAPLHPGCVGSPPGWLVTSRLTASPTLRVSGASPQENLPPASAGRSQQQARPGPQGHRGQPLYWDFSFPSSSPSPEKGAAGCSHPQMWGLRYWDLEIPRSPRQVAPAPGPLFTCTHLVLLHSDPQDLGRALSMAYSPCLHQPRPHPWPWGPCLLLGARTWRALVSSRFQELVGEGPLVLGPRACFEPAMGSLPAVPSALGAKPHPVGHPSTFSMRRKPGYGIWPDVL